jgi:hypothetical protein
MVAAAAAAAAEHDAAAAAAERSGQGSAQHDGASHSVRPLDSSAAAAAAAAAAGVHAGGGLNNSSRQASCNLQAAAQESRNLAPAVPAAAAAAADTAGAYAGAAAAEAAAAGSQYTADTLGLGSLNNRTLSKTLSLPGSSQAAGCGEVRVSELLQQLGLQQFQDVFEQQMIFSVSLLLKMDRQDYIDIGVPKGAALVIMERCRQLLQGQQQQPRG